MSIRLILLDLDGTLLRSDRTISDHTLVVLERCRKKGILIGISTARGETNIRSITALLKPELVISSGGALVRYCDRIIYSSAFSADESRTIIMTGLSLTAGQCEITVDTDGRHYWNYKQDPTIQLPDWGEVIYTDYSDFHEESYKISVELTDAADAEMIAQSVTDCDFAKFIGTNWYKFTKSTATKAYAIREIAAVLDILCRDMIAFGDDAVDIEMLNVCGTGVAMGNAIDAVKAVADAITETNDNDGVAVYLENYILRE